MDKGVILFLFILGHLLVGCRGKELEISLPYSGDKLVLWGDLTAGKSIRVQLTRTFIPIGEIPAELTVDGAHVEVFKNGEAWITLTPSEDEPGVYISTVAISAGETYQFKARAEGYPEAESEEIPIPEFLSAISYARERDVPPIINPYTPQDRISLTFSENENYRDKYVMLSFFMFYKEDTVASYWPAPDNVVANEADCHTWASSKRRKTSFLFSGQCLPAAGATLKFYIENRKNHFISWEKPSEYEYPWKVELRIGSISKEWFDYAKIEYDQPEGLDRLVLPPQMTFTNVKNGYGLIFASNETTVELK